MSENARSESSLAPAVRRDFVRIFATCALLLGTFAVVHLRGEFESRRLERAAAERLNVALGREAIARRLQGIVSDLTYLAEVTRTQGFLDHGYDSERRALARAFMAFSRHRGVYDQIRLIARNGLETVRVERNGGDPVSVPVERLQSKSARYYFEAAYRLDPGGVYISPLDLNVEHARIEDPPKPVLRIAMPISDSRGRKQAVLVLNYLGESLLRAFRQATAAIADHVVLVDRNGYWLSSPRPEDAWGFMYGTKRTFATEQPAAWARARTREAGQIDMPAGLVTFSTVHPVLPAAATDRPTWKIVALSPRVGLLADPALTHNLPFYLAMLALLAAGSVALAYVRVRRARAEDAVEFERRFHGILERIDLLAVGIDATGHIDFCNDAFLSLLGRERAELLGKDWFAACVPPERRDRERKVFERVLSRESEPGSIERDLWRGEGDVRRVAWNDTLALDSRGQITGVTRIGEDVTEARAADQSLRKLSRAVEQSPGGVMIVGSDGLIEYVNPRVSELTGYSAEELIGQSPSLLKSGYASESEYRRLWEVVTSGGQWRGLFCNRKKNGELYWETASISGVRDAAGNITHYVAVKEDITERRRMEARFQQVVESSPYAVTMVNESGDIVLVNGKTEELFGYPREELIGTPVERLLPDSIRVRHARLRDAYGIHPKARPMGVGLELCGQRRDGSRFPVEVGLSPIESVEGRLVLGAIVDISARKALESELAERNREIARGEALAVVGRMANMVAHDLRNPLSSIKMTLQMLAGNGDDLPLDEEQELCAIALDQVRYMEAILGDLLSYSREQTLKPAWVDAPALVEAALSGAERGEKASRVACKIEIAAGLPKMRVDADRLRQVLSNLLANAKQAAESGASGSPRVVVRVRFEDGAARDRIRFEVEDNGSGIDPGECEHAFEPFYTTRAQGTGLGLAIVRRIVEQHGGHVSLERSREGGTRAVFVLPVAEDAKRSGRTALSERGPSGSPEGGPETGSDRVFGAGRG